MWTNSIMTLYGLASKKKKEFFLQSKKWAQGKTLYVGALKLNIISDKVKTLPTK